MDNARIVRISKYLSKHLRHQPQRIGLQLQPGGWVDVADLLQACARHGFPLTRAELDEVVAGNDKQRFAFDDTGTRIRAQQGHSVPVDLELAPMEPPSTLFHGTVARNLAAILRAGLLPMSRHHVHLSADIATARIVGARRGTPVLLAVDAAAMHRGRFSILSIWQRCVARGARAAALCGALRVTRRKQFRCHHFLLILHSAIFRSPVGGYLTFCAY